MGAGRIQVASLISVLAGVIACIVAVFLPALYYVVSYQYNAAAIETEAEINARIASQLINQNPDMWRYEQDRLEELLSRRPGTRDKEIRRIKDARGALIVEIREEVRPPLITAARPLLDSGRGVGVIEISRSLRPLFVRTGLLALFSFLLGFATYAVLRTVPLRALNKAMDALHQEKEKAQITLRSIGDGVITTDSEGNVTMLNEVAERLTGWTSREAEGRPVAGIFPLIHEETREACENPVLKALATNEVVRLANHTALVARDGAERIVADSAAPIRDADGVIIGAVLTFSDTTEKRRLEEQLLQAQKMEGIGQLAGGIAHDFNNILTAIIGYANIMQMKLHDAPALGAYLDKVLASAERAAKLTQGLLTFSRKQPADERLVDLNSVIRNVKELLLRVIGEDIELKTALAAEELVVLADSTHIEQIVMNLAANARDAMPGGGTLSLQTSRVTSGRRRPSGTGLLAPGDFALLAVADTGTGMDERTRERIFEPFYTTKEVGKGTGLGLAIVYGLVTQYKGHIEVRSEPGRGAAFEIYLPLAHARPEATEEPVAAAPDTGTETVLVVEDDTVVRELITMVLTGAGYTVLEAADGEEALRVFAEHRGNIRMVLLDVIMPRMNGKETYLRLREIDPSVKAIFLSGYTADIISRTGLSREGLPFVQKPVMPQELLRKIREALDAEG